MKQIILILATVRLSFLNLLEVSVILCSSYKNIIVRFCMLYVNMNIFLIFCECCIKHRKYTEQQNSHIALSDPNPFLVGF